MNYPEQIQYQGSARPRGFEPVRPWSLVEQQQAQSDKLNSSMQEVMSAGVAQENRAQEVDDALKSKEIQQLVNFSSTLQKQVVAATERKSQSDLQEGLSMAYMDGLSEAEVADFDAREQQLKAADAGIQLIGDNAQRSGADFLGVQKIRELSGWKAYGYAQGVASQTPGKYAQFIASVEGSLDPTMSVPEKVAVLAQARQQFFAQTGMLEMNPALLNKYAFPGMKEIDAKITSGWREQAEKQAKETMTDEAMQTFFVDPISNYNSSILALERTGLTKGAAMQKLLDSVQDPNVILDIGNTLSWDGKLTNAEKYPARFRDAHLKAMKANQDRFSTYEAEVAQDKQATLNGIMQEISGRDNVTDGEVDEIITKWQQRYGTSEVPKELADYRSNLTLQARSTKEQEDAIKDQIAAGTLTTAELKSGKYSRDLVIKYLSTAQGIDKDFAAGGTASKASSYQTKAVENAIKLKLGLQTTDALTSPSAQLAMGSAVQALDSMAKKLKATNPDMSWNEAYQAASFEIIKDIRDPNSKTYATNGKYGSQAAFTNFESNSASAASVQNLRVKQKQWSNSARTDAVFTPDGGVFTTQEVQAMAKPGEGNLSKLSLITTMYNQQNPDKPLTLDGARQMMMDKYGVENKQPYKQPDEYEQTALSANMLNLLTRPTPARLNRVSAQGALVPPTIRRGTAGATDVINTAVSMGMPPHLAPLAAAQWALESGWGKYQSGKNNAFGIKGAGTTVQTQEDYGNGMVSVNASFRDYNSPQESVRDYVELLQQPRYAAVMQARTPAEALRAVKAAGYATDSAYVSKGMAMFRQMGIDPNKPYNHRPLTASPWSNPALMGSAAKKFVTGNTGIGTGEHLDMRVYDPSIGDYVDPTGYQDALTVDGGIPIRRKFAMTSGYGPRRAPVAGASTFHKGLDFATPSGTAISVRGGRYLRSWWDDGGGGVVTSYRLPDGKELRLLHGSKENLRS